jgi:hypothetical protein
MRFARLQPLVSSPLAEGGKPISSFSQLTTCASTCTAELSRPERLLFIAAAASAASAPVAVPVPITRAQKRGCTFPSR